MADIPKPNFSNALWASGGAIVAPSNVKIQTGWTAEVPPFQWENYLQNRQDQGIAHILQHGVSVWDALTEYQAGKSYVQGSDGLLYKAITTNTNINPVTDVSNSGWFKIGGGLLGTRTISASTTYVPTPGTTSIIVEVFGAGGGGGGTPATGAGVAVSGGGGGGGYAVSRATSGFSSVVVTVGAGGVGGSSSGGNGGNGTNTTFGGIASAAGGTGGIGGTALTTSSNGLAPGGPSAGGTGSLISAFGSRGTPGIQVGVAISAGSGGVTGRGIRSGGDGLQSGIGAAGATGNSGNSALIMVWEYS